MSDDHVRYVRYVGPSRRPVVIHQTGQTVVHASSRLADGPDALPTVAAVPPELAEQLTAQRVWELADAAAPAPPPTFPPDDPDDLDEHDVLDDPDRAGDTGEED